MIDLRYVKKLIDMLDASSVDSIEITSDKGMKLRIAKSPQGRAAPVLQAALPTAMPGLLAPAMDVGAMLTPMQGMPAIPAPQVATPAAEPAAAKGVEITSPMVGTFYGAAEPGSPPFAAVGQRVAKGQVVCIIEAMKIMNEIESDYDGVVTAVLAQNGHPVEYGQPLFRVDPTG